MFAQQPRQHSRERVFAAPYAGQSAQQLYEALSGTRSRMVPPSLTPPNYIPSRVAGRSPPPPPNRNIQSAPLATARNIQSAPLATGRLPPPPMAGTLSSTLPQTTSQSHKMPNGSGYSVNAFNGDWLSGTMKNVPLMSTIPSLTSAISPGSAAVSGSYVAAPQPMTAVPEVPLMSTKPSVTPAISSGSAALSGSYVAAPQGFSGERLPTTYGNQGGQNSFKAMGCKPIGDGVSPRQPLMSTTNIQAPPQSFGNTPAVGSQAKKSLEESNQMRDKGWAKIWMNDPTEQDSDLMERMADGTYVGCQATGEVQLVSLGCSCGPKLSFKDIGRGAETLPFDWSRTKIDALFQFLSTGFAGFFDSAVHHIKYADEEGKEWNAFRSPVHSFWHDDPTNSAMRERYTRRIHRFMNIDARSKPVLFVRAVASTAEIARVPELLQLLVSKFGPRAKLLLIADFQYAASAGLFGIPGMDNLLLCQFDTIGAASQTAPYGPVLREALKWAIGQPIRIQQLRSMPEFQARLRHTDWGMYGAAKVPAFV